MKKCSHHCLPTGAVPIPANEDGKRVCDGHKFHCCDWSNDGEVHHSGSTKEDPFPESQDGSPDADLLEHLGLLAARMQEDDGAPDCFSFTSCCFRFAIQL